MAYKLFIVRLHQHASGKVIWQSDPLDQLTMYTLMGILAGDDATLVTCEAYQEEEEVWRTSGEPGENDVDHYRDPAGWPIDVERGG